MPPYQAGWTLDSDIPAARSLGARLEWICTMVNKISHPVTRISSYLALAWLILIGTSTWASCVSPFTLEQVRSYAFPASLVASEKGARVAWTIDDHGRRNVWAAAGPKFQARQLTKYADDDGQEITSLQISPDGEWVVYVRGGEHGGNWDRGLPTNTLSQPSATTVEIWSLRFHGGEPVLLAQGDTPSVSPDNRQVAFLKDDEAWVVPVDGSLPATRLFTIRGKTRSLEWSPDASRLAFVSMREAHSIVGVYSDAHTPILWIAPSTSHDGTPRWSPDGKRIAFVRLPGDGGVPAPALQLQPTPWSIWVAEARTGVASRRWASGESLRDSYDDRYLAWATDDRIVFRSYQDGWQHLYSVAALSGEPLLLTPGNYMVEDVVLSKSKRYLVFNANVGNTPDDIDRRHLFKVPVDRADVQALTTGEGLEWAPVVTEGNQVLFFTATARRPPMLGTLAFESGSVRLLTPELLGRDYPVEHLIAPRRVSFQAADGTTVHAQLFSSPHRTGKRPAVVYLHGGPQRQMLLGWHYKAYYANDYATNQYLASCGYIVLAVNYRLGIGYGHDFHFPSGAGRRGAAEYQDVRAAGQYLRSLSEVDPQRIGLYGGSYGGYLTAMGLAYDSDLFAAGVDIHGVHDWTMDYGADELLPGKRYEMPIDAARALSVAWQSSPVAAVASWRSPVLFIHGDDDRNVRFSQTVDLVRRLQRTSVHAETLVLVDETHNLHRYANELRMNQAIVDFLDLHIGMQ
jgi:dipeptidyl aminopeptidase/acylaminoacyl peptidase